MVTIEHFLYYEDKWTSNQLREVCMRVIGALQSIIDQIAPGTGEHGDFYRDNARPLIESFKAIYNSLPANTNAPPKNLSDEYNDWLADFVSLSNTFNNDTTISNGLVRRIVDEAIKAPGEIVGAVGDAAKGVGTALTDSILGILKSLWPILLILAIIIGLLIFAKVKGHI
jgi:adenine-specific DNA methylase